MRRDFRVKLDFSRIYEDVRRNSWVFVDGAKVHLISHLAEHIQKLFNVSKPFHLLAKYEELFFFLPFEEDVRVLENNDTVLIVPGNIEESKKDDSTVKHDFAKPEKYKQNGVTNTDKATFTQVSDVSYVQSTVANTSDSTSLNGTFYKTALHETAYNDTTKDSNITENNFTEDNSMGEENLSSNKRKRIRKRKTKKNEVPEESDASVMEISGKKPKIINSVLVSTGKHIRFQGIEEEDTTSDTNATKGSSTQRSLLKNELTNNQFANTNLSTLLNLRQQSSTPLTFTHKRVKRDYIQETFNNNNDKVIDVIETPSQTNQSSMCFTKSVVESETSADNSQLNKTIADNDMVSFKILRIGEDCTPQISKVIVGKVLASSTDGLKYTFKILHGKEELKEPDSKFSLPKDEESSTIEDNDIITFEKSKLLELCKVDVFSRTNNC